MSEVAPKPELGRDWQERIDIEDLAASGEHIDVKQCCIVLNGKPTGFTDVKEGPAVYVGRENAHYDLQRSKLANPHPVAEHGRLDSLLKYVETLIHAIEEDDGIEDRVRELYGQPIACWCRPKLCHADVLALYLAYRYDAGLDPRKIEQVLKRRIQNRVDHLLKNGEANPADYY